jgi:hypothetical protein
MAQRNSKYPTSKYMEKEKRKRKTVEHIQMDCYFLKDMVARK